MPPINNQDDQLRRILDAIEANKADTAARFESLRRELSALFVPRAEFDPKYSIIQEKIIKIETIQDRMLTEARTRDDESIRLRAAYQDMDKDMKEMQEKRTNIVGTIGIITSIIVAIGSLALSIIQHVHIT